jgi:hypothetical protein
LSRLQLDGAATEGLATRSRQARIVLLTAETSSHFLLLIIYVILIFFTGWIVVVVVGALALPRMWKVFRATLNIIDGLRAVTGRFVRGVIFVI